MSNFSYFLSGLNVVGSCCDVKSHGLRWTNGRMVFNQLINQLINEWLILFPEKHHFFILHGFSSAFGGHPICHGLFFHF